LFNFDDESGMIVVPEDIDKKYKIFDKNEKSIKKALLEKSKKGGGKDVNTGNVLTNKNLAGALAAFSKKTKANGPASPGDIAFKDVSAGVENIGDKPLTTSSQGISGGPFS
jgi:hypothetical protein